MPRRPRDDAPDRWHHVMNRGIARRTIFETDADRRYFLSLLGREVRAGRIEVHAYALMLTHFHLLVRSVTGELSEAMRRVQNRYARWFNRTRRRDGPLFRGRFLSRPVDSLRYRRRVVTYIHDNPLAAGIVSDPAAYPWSSAWHFSREARPLWLASGWIDAEIASRGAGATLPERLASAFPSSVDEEFRRWVEAQLNSRLPDQIEDVSLKHAGSPRVVRWALRKAELADGTRPWRPVCDSSRVSCVFRGAMRAVGPLLGLFRSKAKDAWIAMRAGLLRLLAGATHREIAFRIGRHPATISRDVKDHLHLLETVPSYAALAAKLTHSILDSAA